MWGSPHYNPSPRPIFLPVVFVVYTRPGPLYPSTHLPYTSLLLQICYFRYHDMSHTPGPHDLRSSNRSPALLAGSITLIAAATFAVILRLVARRIKKISWAADDLLAIVAVGFAYAMFTSIVFCW